MSVANPELLAPAGDWDALRAGVLNGADAVYFGLDQFNARHRATNFKLAELPEVMAYLHAHNVKGYLTFNTLIFSEELESAEEYLKAVAKAGTDAVIVQDLGIAELIHRMCPGLRIHGSTQMTLTEPRGIAFVRELGVSRVVLAREMSVKDISRAIQNGGGDVEVFIHGAMCVAYSGQCLTSESLGGRSANRGQCAQACRLPYELVVDGTVKDLGDKAYLLSPSDLAAYDLIGELTDAGVSSFKIEGRLKSAHYVAATCQTYRSAIDAAIAKQKFEITPSARLDLEQTFSRGFTHGFLGGVNHQELVAARFPKARGTRIGLVCGKTPRGVKVRLESPKLDPLQLIKAGDGVVFDEGHPEQDEQGGRVHAVKRIGDTVDLEFGVGDVNLSYINDGAIVWKTDDPAVKRRLEHSFAREDVARRVRIDFAVKAAVGEVLEVKGRAQGREVIERWEEKKLERAQKFAVTVEVLREQLGRLGGTPFELGEVALEGTGAMVPKSVMNDLRRRVCEGLVRGRERKVNVRNDVLEEMRREIGTSEEHGRDARATVHVLVRSLEQLEAVIAHKPADGAAATGMIYLDFEDVRRYAGAVAQCKEAGMPVGIATLRVVKPGEEGFLNQVLDCGADALLVRCLAAVGFYKEKAPKVPLVGDYSLNVSNELTAGIFAKAGLVRMAPSYDLNWTQMAAMLRRFDAGRFEVVVHQHMPMFHMEHCVFAHVMSGGKDFRDCGRPCEKHKVELSDRMGENHPLVADVGCRNTVFNGRAQSGAEYVPEMRKLGIRHFRVEMLRESGAEAGRVLERYSRVVAGLGSAVETVRSLRVLNQLGVTRGTLAHE